MPEELKELVASDLRPIGDKIIVKPLRPEEISKGGIIIPDSVKKPPLVGYVLAAGPGRHSELGTLLPMEVKAGDKIFYSRFAGTQVQASDAEPVILMCVDDVLAVYEPGDRHKYCACDCANQKPQMQTMEPGR
jgi:chaperonin GroES